MRFLRFARYCLCLQTFSYFLSSLLCPLLQVSTIATSDDYAKNLASSFEAAARLQGIRIYASSRFSSRASPEVLDSKVQLVRDVLSVCLQDLTDSKYLFLWHVKHSFVVTSNVLKCFLAEAVCLVKIVASSTVMFSQVIVVCSRVWLPFKTSCYHPKMFLIALKLHHQRVQNSLNLQSAKISISGKRMPLDLDITAPNISTYEPCFLSRKETFYFNSQERFFLS